MPPSVENCVKRLLGDPDFKPYTGQSKKDSAWAICTAQYEKETGKPAKKYKMEKAMKPVKPMPDGSCPEGYEVDKKLGMCMPLDDRKPQDEAYEKHYTEDVVNQIGMLKGYLK
jgi:hypothetical protein